MTDSWFVARYAMNLYRGCEHGCVYCDGRAERYYVEGDFERDIIVKGNAVELLRNELSRLPEPGFLFLGGGVSDAYQPAEEQHGLARGALELALKYGVPVHVLTKSALVERDLDLLEAIAKETSAILSFSINTTSDSTAGFFEPGASPLSERWRVLGAARARGIATGVMAMPMLPGVTDGADDIQRLVAQAARTGVDFILSSGLTLRPGRQRENYMVRLRERHPQLVPQYRRLYAVAIRSGSARGDYYRRIDAFFTEARHRHGIPPHLPHSLFASLIPAYSELSVLLQHKALRERLAGRPFRHLEAAGVELEQWAETRLRNARGKATFRDVEREFMVNLERARQQPFKGITTLALQEARALAATLMPSRAPTCGQLSLF